MLQFLSQNIDFQGISPEKKSGFQNVRKNYRVLKSDLKG